MKRTERGFAIYGEVTDSKRQGIRVQKSSIATEDAVWIFVDPPTGEHRCQQGAGGENHGQTGRAPGGGLLGCVCRSPHLTVEQARVVRDALTMFIREHS